MLSLALHRQELVVGVTKEVTMNISLTNSGEDSYMTNMALSYPRNLQFKKIEKVLVTGAWETRCQGFSLFARLILLHGHQPPSAPCTS